jgi:hypothetical protein
MRIYHKQFTINVSKVLGEIMINMSKYLRGDNLTLTLINIFIISGVIMDPEAGHLKMLRMNQTDACLLGL